MPGGMVLLLLLSDNRGYLVNLLSLESKLLQVVPLFIILQNPRTWGLQCLRDEPWLSKHKHPLELPLAALHSPVGQWHALNIPSGLSYVMFIGVALGCSYVLDCLCCT